MSALLLKDFYMVKRYCRAYLLIAVVFCVASVANQENLFFTFYPCLLCGMIPVNLLAYDERSRWMQYCGTLPYTKAQIVSGKYLVSLITMVTVLVMTGIAQIVRMLRNGCFDLKELLMILTMVLTMAAITSSITIPFIFRWGVEKGRIAYYVMIGFVCAGGVLAGPFLQTQAQAELSDVAFFALLALIGVGVYALSWYLSILFFRKRELR